MSNGTTEGDVNHVVVHEGGRATFPQAHCVVTIVGNVEGDQLKQYWWGVTPNEVFSTKHQNLTITWSLNIKGIIVDQQGPWGQATWDDSGEPGATGGITFDEGSGWNPDWGTPTRKSAGPRGEYELVVSDPSAIPAGATFRYSVNWKVGDDHTSFDPELEIGQD